MHNIASNHCASNQNLLLQRLTPHKIQQILTLIIANIEYKIKIGYVFR
jgi:hypothetical protein